jgi:hypothetical protein
MVGERYNRIGSRAERIHLLLMLLGVLTVCLWIVSASGGGTQPAYAQQVQYGSASASASAAPPLPGPGGGGGAVPGDDGANNGTPGDGDGATTDGDNEACSGNVSSVEPAFEEWNETAKVVYNAPNQMQLGETKTIELLLSSQMLFGQLAQRLTEPGEVMCVTIAVGDLTLARLKGSNFEIEPLTPETQQISPEGTTQWKWEVEPTKAGEGQKLHLTVSAFVRTPSGTEPHAVITLDRIITVNVTWGQRVANFLNLGSTPLVALVPILTAAGALGTWLGTRLQSWRANRRERIAGATRSSPSPESRRGPPPFNGP